MLGRFSDLGPLGEGGLAVVRRVYDPQLRRVVALKMLKPEVLRHHDLTERFLVEAQATAQLQHPGIVPVFEASRLPDGRPYYTMREVKGHTLLQAIDDAYSDDPRRWRPRELVQLFRRVVEAMAYAHDRGVVHRDLKPENVMVGEFGEVLVLDWGLAKVMGPCSLNGEDEVSVRGRSTTQWGRILGTPRSMAPEQAAGDNQRVGPPTDVYALGVMLFHVLTGTPAFDGSDTATILRNVLRGDRAPLVGPASIPRHLRTACDRAMAFDSKSRFAHAGVMLASLDLPSRRLAVAVRIGIQVGTGFEHAILPLGEGLTLEGLRKRIGCRLLPDVDGDHPLFRINGSKVVVSCPHGGGGQVVDEGHSDVPQPLNPGRAITVEAGRTQTVVVRFKR